jgi:hypothetical protein
MDTKKSINLLDLSDDKEFLQRLTENRNRIVYIQLELLTNSDEI